MSICLFTRTAHSFACSAQLASLACCAALIRLLTRPLHLLHSSWENRNFDVSVSGYSEPQCVRLRSYIDIVEYSGSEGSSGSGGTGGLGGSGGSGGAAGGPGGMRDEKEGMIRRKLITSVDLFHRSSTTKDVGMAGQEKR